MFFFYFKLFFFFFSYPSSCLLSTKSKMSLSQTTRTHGNIFHQRRPSLTTSCPPPDKRKSFDLNKRRGSSQYALKTNRKSWVNKVFDMPVIQLVGWTYVLICFCLSTIHLVRAFSLLDPTNSGKITYIDLRTHTHILSNSKRTSSGLG